MTDISSMSRDELEQCVDDLETQLQGMEARLDAYETRFDRLLTVVLGERELAEDKLMDGPGLYEQLNEGDADAFSEAAREEMLPVHRMAVDIRHGREERLPSKTAARAAELFRRMMHKVDEDGKPMPGVENSLGTVKIDSGTAAEIITEFDDDLDTAASAIVGRAFRELQRLTKRQDCNCDDIDGCGHGLVIFDPGTTNRVQANTTRLISYLGTLNAIETDGDGGADGGDCVLETTADETLDQLDAGDSAESANTVVSTNDRTVFAAMNGHDAGDNYKS